MKYQIDAEGRTVGRVATEAATILRGKNTPAYARNKNPEGVTVTIVNASKARIAATKMIQKKYLHYTGYPGGLKSRSMKDALSKRGHREVFRLAVYGMLPGNKLRAQLMKRLTIVD